MLRNHSNGKTTAIHLHGRRYQIHVKYDDNVEKIEEFTVVENSAVKGSTSTCSGNKNKDNKNNNENSKKLVVASYTTTRSQEEVTKSASFQLISRKWKDLATTATTKNNRNQGCWEYEIGRHKANDQDQHSIEATIMSSSSTNPSFHAEDSTTHFIWKFEKCPWPLQNYSINVEDGDTTAVLRTSNKKYFKRFLIPGMSRQNEKLIQEEFEMEHDEKLKVLKISYRKPESVLRSEDAESKLREDALSKLEKEGSIDCRQS